MLNTQQSSSVSIFESQKTEIQNFLPLPDLSPLPSLYAQQVVVLSQYCISGDIVAAIAPPYIISVANEVVPPTKCCSIACEHTRAHTHTSPADAEEGETEQAI